MDTGLVGEPRVSLCSSGLLELLAMLVSLSILTLLVSQAVEPSPQDRFTRFCLDCHESPRPKANLDLAAAVANPADVSEARWRQVLGHLRGRTMPPQKARRRPGDADYLIMAAWVRDQLPEVRPTTLRRLNATEYRNTIRDLFGITFDADAFFPDDDVGYGFDTIGDVLAISPLLMERYLDAAEVIAAEAVRDPEAPVFPMMRRSGLQLGVQGAGKAGPSGVRMHSRADAIATFPIDSSGHYRLRFQAAGQQAGDEPVRFAVAIDGRRIATAEVPETRRLPGIRVFDVPLDVASGPRDAEVRVTFINDFYRPDHPDPSERDRNAMVEWIELEGPLDAPITSDFQVALPVPAATQSELDWLQAVLEGQLPRIWRGPVAAKDLAALIDVAVASTPQTASRETRLRTALTAAMVSPRFLFRLQRAEADSTPHTLATRLAAFLWSSTPPDWLLAMAAGGRLNTKAGRREATERLLRDPRSRALAENFATQWLQIRDLPSRHPEPGQFPGVDQLRLAAMQMETILFFDEILRTDLPVETLLEADFTFVNPTLVEHYDLSIEAGDGFRRVDLSESDHHGGILHHASILTATSNPTRTSIVKRGKWVLEALLDQPPPAPPPGLDGLPEDGAAETMSLREQMERHRSDASCASCHIRMDALGFALESLDAVGRRRDTAGGLPIDDRGQLPDGQIIIGPDQLSNVLVADPAFRRALVRNLLIYALGRGLLGRDEPVVAILTESLGRDNSLRALIHKIVESTAFRPAQPK